MKKFFSLLLIVVVAFLSIPIIGFCIGKFINLIYDYEATRLATGHNFYPYSFSIFTDLMIIIYIMWFARFIPFYFFAYLFLRLISQVQKVRILVSYIALLICYFLYGLFFYPNDFWRIKRGILREGYTLRDWLGSEHKDMYISIASLLSLVLFVWLINRQNLLAKVKGEPDEPK